MKRKRGKKKKRKKQELSQAKKQCHLSFGTKYKNKSLRINCPTCNKWCCFDCLSVVFQRASVNTIYDCDDCTRHFYQIQTSNFFESWITQNFLFFRHNYGTIELLFKNLFHGIKCYKKFNWFVPLLLIKEKIVTY